MESAPVRAQQRDLSGRLLFFNRLHFEHRCGRGRRHSRTWEKHIRTFCGPALRFSQAIILEKPAHSQPFRGGGS